MRPLPAAPALFAMTVLGMSVLTLSVPATAQDRAVDAVIEDVIVQAVRPGFAALKAEAETMADVATALCASPSDGALADAREQFGDLVDAWGRVEFVRPGPLSQDNRLERILFWPDRRGRGLGQIQGVIASGDETALSAATLAEKSVAVQGLAALEYALFGTGSEQLAAGEAGTRCTYVQAIAENVATVAGEVHAGWQADDGIASLWREPSADNPLFRDEAEQINGLIKLIGDALEIIKVQRLDPVLGEDPEAMRPRAALFWRSDYWVPSLEANIAGLAALMEAARLGDTVSGDDARVIATVDFELGNAARALVETDVATAAISEDEAAWSRMNYVRIVVDGLVTLTDTQLPAIYGLSSGFSSLDGD